MNYTDHFKLYARKSDIPNLIERNLTTYSLLAIAYLFQPFVFSMSISKTSGNKTKRKIADEHRIFQEKWELEYFSCEVNGKIFGMKKQQSIFNKVLQENEKAVDTSYVLSELIAKHSKPFTEVAERITDLATNLSDQIKAKSSSLESFSIACDESTDIVWILELLELIPMHGTTTGHDIFNSVFELLQKYNLPLSKLNSVATDGAPSMTGKNNGSKIHHKHCIIHQEVLCTKVIKIENVLSCSQTILGFERRNMCKFLQTKNEDTSLFSDQMWLQDLSFMVDITKHLSDLNLLLQGKDQIITNIFDIIKAFKQNTNTVPLRLSVLVMLSGINIHRVCLSRIKIKTWEFRYIPA
ncbi:general transcription factor II-I repeat domain-containing protein 2-like [Xylocopa sonorina]|uniref:general transcription factor II-I repeat domain-containing protein 2-like n=1 Tax=Xylocopa sonorina TaxID=1818115 RepID=UPI00403AF68A